MIVVFVAAAVMMIFFAAKKERKKPVLAMDIDETIAETAEVLTQKFGEREDGCYEFKGLPENFFEENPQIYLGLRPVKGSVEGIKCLVKAYRVIYVTKRSENARAVTLLWLLMNGYPLRKVCFVKDKGEAAVKYGVSYAVDDSPLDVKEYEQNDVKVFVVRKSYNRDLENASFAWQ